MNRLNTIIRRSLVYLAPAGFVIYLRIPTLYAKDAKDAKEDVKKAARDACKKAFKCLLADHSDCDQDAKTIPKCRFSNSGEVVEEESLVTSSLVKCLKVFVSVLKFIFADHGENHEKPETEPVKPDREDGDGDDAEPEDEKEMNVNESVVRHSAKCAILTKKGGVYCTIPGKDDEEYESSKDVKCFPPEYIERHDYNKIFADSKEVDHRKPTFKERKLISYENRLRCYSTPDKIFRYFATLERYSTEDEQGHLDHGARRHEFHANRAAPRVRVFMNPEDFVRSISPGSLQPRELGLDMYRAFDPLNDKVVCNLAPNSIFYEISKDGLLNFSDYMFLLMVLTHPVRHFRMAFNLFDEKGNGHIDGQSFQRIEHVMLAQTKMGKDHRDHGDNVLSKSTLTSQIAKYFFGDDLQGKLEVEMFVEFQRRLKEEVNSLEFDAYSPDRNDSIDAMDFVDSMTKYINGTTAEMTRVKKMKKNVQQFIKDQKSSQPAAKAPRLSREEFLAFNKFLCYPVLMKMAFESYHAAGVKITRDVFKLNASQIAGAELSDNLVGLVYIMLGNWEDNDLDERLFRKIMKSRTTFGLKTSDEQPNIAKKLGALKKCLGPQYEAFIRLFTSGDKSFCNAFCKDR